MASKIDFLKRGLTAEAKDFLDEVIQFTKTEATKAFDKAISNKEIDQYIKKAKEEDWVAGPVETLCDDYWFDDIENNVLKKMGTTTPDVEQEVKNIPDLDNVLYGIYAETFTALMVKKGHDDAKYHNELFDDEFTNNTTIEPDDSDKIQS